MEEHGIKFGYCEECLFFTSDHPLVATFLREHGFGKQGVEYVQGITSQNLHTALSLISDSKSVNATKLRKIIESELDDRAIRGA